MAKRTGIKAVSLGIADDYMTNERTSRTLRAIRVALGLLLLPGCGLVTNPGGLVAAKRALMQNMSRWRDHGFASYDYVVSNRCFCMLGAVPVRVSVREDAIVAVVFADDGQPIGGGLSANYRDVPGLFRLIEDAIDAGAASIRASYDPVTGYPADVFIDHIRNAADDEFGFSVLSFTPIQQ